MNEVVLNELPDSWEWTKLGDVVTKIIGGGTPSKNKPQYWEGDIPWLTVKDMRSRRPADAMDHISEKAVQESSTNIIPEDTVIIATRIGLGKVIRVPYMAAINQDLKALILPSEVEKGYLEYWFVSKTNYLESIGSGTTVKGIRLEQVRNLDFPLAPLEQQKRIVAKIEELFSHIDAGIEALKKAKQLLKQYRQSVLKAAVTGELTKEWREANKDKLEPASQLLERILKERRQKWEAQRLEQFKAKGKIPTNDKWKAKYKEPVVPDATELPNLPDEWLWSGFEQVSSPEKNGMKAGPFGSALKKQFYVEKGYKIYGQEQVINNAPYFGDYYIDEEKYQSLINCAVKPGDFLISLVGTIGRTLVLPEGIEPGIINPRLIKITFDKKLCMPEYVQLYVASPAAKQIFRLSSHGGTMDVLNMGTLKALPLPLPPVSEQKAIVESVKEKEDAIVRQLNYIDNQMHLIEKSKQSILASAFSGKLERFKWQ